MILSSGISDHKQHQRTSSTTPTRQLSSRKTAEMNISNSSHNDSLASTGDDDKAKESGVINRTSTKPGQSVKRLLSPKTWHAGKAEKAEKTKSRNRSFQSECSANSANSANNSPPASPRTRRKERRSSRSARDSRTSTVSETDESIQQILAPNVFSSTPSQRERTKVATSPNAMPPLESAGDNDNSRRALSSSEDDSSRRSRSTSLLQKASTGGANLIEKPTIPAIYKFARKCHWDEFEQAIPTSSPDMDFVYDKDGTTVLHMAVMSRTGYVNAFKSSEKEFAKAPLKLIEEILYNFPQLAHVKCTLNGYTPLTYVCLVCSSTYDVEDAAKMARLFLTYCPGSIKLFTKDGLSPVDIHVVSYSHHNRRKEEGSGLGRTSASVLRTLLTHSPELAVNRIFKGKVKGPIELMYKCNAQAFSKAVMDEIYNGDDFTVRSDFTIPERRQKVVDTVKKWWIWTWTVMILKYGSLSQKKRGAPFSAVHTASMQIGCAAPILSITLYAFPRQIKQPILDKDSLENLPLHAVCSWDTAKEKGLWPSLLETRKSQAIVRVIEDYPAAAKVTNRHGETPLEIAAKSGTTWDGGVRRLVKAYPKSLKVPSETTGLYPFMTAAVAGSKGATCEERDKRVVQTIYGLLRSNPRVMIHTCTDE